MTDDTENNNIDCLLEALNVQNGIADNQDLKTTEINRDSSDEEVEKYPFSKKYNDFGYDINQKLKCTNHADSSHNSSNVGSWKSNPKNVSLQVPSKPTNSTGKSDFYAEPIFGLRIINPIVSSQFMQSKMVNRQAIPIYKLKQHLYNGDRSVDWVFAGAIVFKTGIKTSQKGSQYCIWKVSDLKGEMKQITLYLFGKACNELWKLSLGMVIAVLNASTFQNTEEGKSDDISLMVRNPDQIMQWGTSKDFGICKAKKNNGDNCTAVINKTECEFCIYHIKREYSKFTGKRSELYSPSYGPNINLRNKVLGKNEVFYGGKSYTAIKAPVQNRKHKEKDRKILTSLSNTYEVTGLMSKNLNTSNHKIEDTHNNFAIPVSTVTNVGNLKNSETINTSTVSNNQQQNALSDSLYSRSQKMKDAYEKMKITGKPVRISAASATVKNSCITFAELFSQDAKITETKTKKEISMSNSSTCKKSSLTNQKDFLKIDVDSHNNAIQENHVPNISVAKISNSNNRQSIQNDFDLDIIDDSDTMGDKKHKLHNNARKLWSENSNPSKLFNSPSIGISYRRNQLMRAKKEAVVLVKQIGGLQKCDPNAVKSSSNKNKRKREINDEDKLDNDNEEFAKSKKSVLSDRFLELMNADSQHANLVLLAEDVEQQAYFNKMEQKEQLEEKMLNTYKVPCKAVTCVKCRYKWFSASDLCKSEGHPIKIIDSVKRFFKCSNCRNRIVSLEIFPLIACKQCGSSKWTRAPMMREKLAKISPDLSIRGFEETFINSVVTNENLDLLVPE